MVSKAVKGLYYIPKKGPFDTDLGRSIPEAYKKFYFEWKNKKATAVHYFRLDQNIAVDDETGHVKRLQEYPIPVIYPAEHNNGLWGGEGIIRGFQKRHPLRRRVPHFWVPTLQKSVVYSEILDRHMEVVVTDRLLRLIHENYGFDNYILKTPANDLKSTLALQIKQKMLLTLVNKDMYHKDLQKQEEVYNKYKKYSEQYSNEEIEWYGLTLKEAILKQKQINRNCNPPEPTKKKYRYNLIEKLKEAGIQDVDDNVETTNKSWLNRINVFSSKDAHSS